MNQPPKAGKSVIAPLYIALDGSAADPMRYYPSGIHYLRDRHRANPLAMAVARLTLVSLSAGRCVRSRWLSLDELYPPPMSPDNGGFGAGTLFRTMRDTIEGDLSYLRGDDNARIYRPTLVLIATSAPSGPWEAQFRALTQYDSTAHTGFRFHPTVVPISLTETAESTLSETAHPASLVTGYTARDVGDPAGSVKAAFTLVGNIIDTLAKATDGQAKWPSFLDLPQGLRRSDDKPDPPHWSEPPSPPTEDRSVIERPGSWGEPSGLGPAAAYLQMRCSRSGALTWNRFENLQSSWLLVESTPDTSAQTHEAPKSVQGQFEVAPGYPGCAECRNPSYAQCYCQRLSCWDTSPTLYCYWCNRTVQIGRRITSAPVVD
jgi:hypothetical protein